jgi:hypothetical protein
VIKTVQLIAADARTPSLMGLTNHQAMHFGSKIEALKSYQAEAGKYRSLKC